MVHSTTMKVAADRNAEVDAADEIDGRFGGDPHIVGDAVFRILVVAADQIELVVAART